MLMESGQGISKMIVKQSPGWQLAADLRGDCVCLCMYVCSVAQSCPVTLWTVAHQAPPSMEFSRQEYSSGLPFSSPGDLPDQGLNSGLPCCRQTLYPLGPQGTPMWYDQYLFFHCVFQFTIFVVHCCLVAQSRPTLRLPWTAACQAFPSFTIFWSLLTLMSTESMMPSNHLILCYPLPLLPSVFPSIQLLPYANMQDIDFCT